MSGLHGNSDQAHRRHCHAESACVQAVDCVPHERHWFQLKTLRLGSGGSNYTGTDELSVEKSRTKTLSDRLRCGKQERDCNALATQQGRSGSKNREGEDLHVIFLSVIILSLWGRQSSILLPKRLKNWAFVDHEHCLLSQARKKRTFGKGKGLCCRAATKALRSFMAGDT